MGDILEGAGGHPDPRIKFWQGERYELLKGLTLIHGGGHFRGGSMLHWAAGADGKGVVCSADFAMVNLDRKSLSFMRRRRPFVRSGQNWCPLLSIGSTVTTSSA